MSTKYIVLLVLEPQGSEPGLAKDIFWDKKIVLSFSSLTLMELVVGTINRKIN